jgi:DNA-binding response OmpR family regulator
MRAEGTETPVIILSAKRSVDDRIRGLQVGGDDYMVKPFSFSELMVRIQTLLRRARRIAPSSTLEVGDLKMNLTNRTVQRAGATIELQPREFALLELFMRNPDRIMTKTAILENVYDYSFDPQTNVVDVLVCRLRNRVDKNFEQKLIHTVRGVGYVLKAEQ